MPEYPYVSGIITGLLLKQNKMEKELKRLKKLCWVYIGLTAFFAITTLGFAVAWAQLIQFINSL